MESTEIASLLEQLDDEIDDLEDSLAPVLKSALSTISSKLPLLDKAKLYVLVTYAIESMLFSYLRLNGVKAREHPVFKELTRVKQYFGKLKAVEAPSNKQPMVNLDKEAAARFIKAGLTGNNKYDSKRAQHQAPAVTQSHTKYDDLSNNAGNGIRSPSSATNNFGPAHVDMDTTRTGSSRSMNASKKRRADKIDDSVPSSSRTARSELEPSHNKLNKSKEGEKKRRKKG